MASALSPSMQWFSTFYHTPAMVKMGLAVTGRGADGDALAYAKECVAFEERRTKQLKEVQAQMEWNKERGEHRDEALLQEEWVEMEKERPHEMLSPAAWSLLHNALHIYDPQSHLLTFSYDTKFRVAMTSKKARGITETLLPTILEEAEEREYGDYPIEKQPVMYLGYGILTSTNARSWDWLDLAKAAEACGHPCMNRTTAAKVVLGVQIELLEEIVGKNWHVEAEGRGYNPILGVLADSKRFLQFLSTKADMKGAEKEAKEKYTGKRKSEAEPTASKKKPKVAAAAASHM